MSRADLVSDAELLHDRGAQFGDFYARHERRLLAYLLRRTGKGELAADLCAEVFAAALTACRRDAPIPDVPVAWLFAIANHKLADSARRSRVEDDARRKLQMRALELTRGEVSEIEGLYGESEVDSLVRGLSANQRQAVLAYVIDECAYSDIAAGLQCSESVVRKRVSRGLARLRLRLEQAR